MNSRLRVSVIAWLASCLTVVASPVEALAQTPEDLTGDGNCIEVAQGEVLCVVNGRSYVNGIAVDSTDTTPSAARYVPYERIIVQADGTRCTTTGWREVTDPTVPDGVYQISDLDFTNVLAGLPPPCPEQPGAAVSPRTIAVRHWEQIPLPKPNPRIAPGWGITGKLAYLETNGTMTYTHTSPTPLGELRIVARGRYEVDWGDGEESGPYSREGGPWPDGTITHDYLWAGTYDVEVTERWTATWQIGSARGLLHELETTGRIDDFRVREIQAVVRFS